VSGSGTERERVQEHPPKCGVTKGEILQDVNAVDRPAGLESLFERRPRRR
jgi:hypothetical protein